MGNTLKKKKGFSMPHVYAVILILMLLVTIMTYVIPAGTYARVDGNVDPNSFTYVEQTPVSFLSFFTSLHQGFVESANVIGAVLLISGAIQIIQKTGAFSAGIQALIKRAKGRDLVMVLLFFTIFTGWASSVTWMPSIPSIPLSSLCSSPWAMTRWWAPPSSCSPPL